MKNLLICFLLLTPFVVLAQDENPPLVKDFYKGVRSIPQSFELNDHVNVMQFNLDDHNFDVVAVDEQMQVLWKTNLQGYMITTRKFRDKILAVAATDFSNVKRNNNTFKAYIIDPATGKVLVEKVIFDGNPDYFTFPFVFTGDGNIFKFAVRQSAFTRRMHVAMPSLLALVSINSYEKEYNQTTDFDVIEFNDKLEPINKFKPVFNTGTFIGMDCNKAGDTFIAWYNEGSLDFVKYVEGQSTPSKPISASIALKKNATDSFGIDIVVQACVTNNNALYYALSFKNQDKENEMGVGKLDFSNGKEEYVNEVFSKDHVKEIKKSYVTVNKKLHSPNLGPVSAIDVKGFYQKNGNVMVALTSTAYSSAMNGGTWVDEYNVLINCYDADLKFKFQQLIPTSYAVPERHLPIGFHIANNKLYVLSNDKEGMTTLYGTFATIDLTTGACDKIYWLSKKKISNSDAAASSSVLWFPGSFVIPYLDLRGFSGRKYDITLQKNSY